MFGPTGSLTEASLQQETTLSGAPVLWGIFPRIALAMVGTAGNTLKASAIEVYNNEPFDLLNGRKPLQVSRSKNAVPLTARVTSKRAPEGGSQFSNSKVGLNGEHPGGCSCHDCFKAEEATKEARKRRIEMARGGSLPPIHLTKKKSPSPKNKFVSSVAKTGARTVGESLWDLKTPNDVAKFARQIETSRVAHEHALNERSSRSHCLVRLQSSFVSGDGKLRKQCFTFVDLAGSERTGKSGVEGQRMSEAIGVNGSLTVLGRCIRAVGKGEAHVPWRDAVLCQLLRTSFEGNASGANQTQTQTHTTVVVNVSPEYEDETMCTLQFGETVACVANRATVVVGRNAESEIAILRSEVQRLRAKKKEMEKSGQASGFVEGCINSEKLSLQANMDKLFELQSHVADLKARVVEESGEAGKSARRPASKLEVVEKEEYIVRMIVLRQQSIKKLWRDATPMFASLVAELQEKENQLRMATGK